MTNRNTYFLTVFVAALMACQSADAQWITLPVGTHAKEAPTYKAARTGAVGLPFFDDFSLAKNGIPDPILWQNGGGTVVNNTLTTGHPTVNVVTFDGIRRDGFPYDFANELANGAIDSLTSQPIDLSGLSPADSVVLSFFYEIRGYGELPDANDSLRVQGLTNTGTWQTLWIQRGGTPRPGFRQVYLPLAVARLLHAGFRVRFQAFGRESGAFDTWHLDYVYLDKNRRFAKRFVKDVAVRQPVSPYLRNYRAMPLTHYLVNPSAATADSIKTDLNNLFDNNNFVTLRFSAKELTTNQSIQQFAQTVSENIPQLSSQEKKVKLSPLPSGIAGSRAVVRTTFDFLTTDDQNPSIPGINLKRNDTLSSNTELADYFAYDDGSAEFAASTNQRLARVAVRFVATRADVLGWVDLHIARLRKDLRGTPFGIQVLANKGGKPDVILTQQAYSVAYPTTPDGLVRFTLQNPVAVKDTFWVAIQQLSDDLLPIGLDKNTPQFAKNITYNLGLAWENNTTLQGTFLLRAVMGGQISNIVTGIVPSQNQRIIVSPNPTAGRIRWSDDSFTTASITSITGEILWEASQLTTAEADISHLPTGLYFLRLSNGEEVITTKVVVVR